MWPTSMPLMTVSGCPQLRARLPRRDGAQVRPAADADVAGDVDAAQVHVVGVGAGHHAGPVPQREIGDDRQVRDADRAERARVRAERGEDLVRLGRPHRAGAGGVDELLLLQGVVAAEQDQRDGAVEDVDQRLDLPVGRGVVTGRQVLDRPHPGGVEPGRLGQGDGRVGRSAAASGQRPRAPTPPPRCSPRSRTRGSRRCRPRRRRTGRRTRASRNRPWRRSTPPPGSRGCPSARRRGRRPGGAPRTTGPGPRRRGRSCRSPSW